MLSKSPFDVLLLELKLAILALLPLPDLLSILLVNRELSQLVPPYIDAWRPYKLLEPCSPGNDLKSQLTHFLETREEDLHFKDANLRTLDISLSDKDHPENHVTASTLVDATPLLVQCIEKFIPLQVQKLRLHLCLCDLPEDLITPRLRPLAAALSRLSNLRFLRLTIYLADFDPDNHVDHEKKAIEVFLDGFKHQLEGLILQPNTGVLSDNWPDGRSAVLSGFQHLEHLKLNMRAQTMIYAWPPRLKRLCLFDANHSSIEERVTDDESCAVWLPTVGHILSTSAETLVELEILQFYIGSQEFYPSTLGIDVAPRQLVFPNLRCLTLNCSSSESTLSVFRSHITTLFFRAPLHKLTFLAFNEEQITIWLHHPVLGREVGGEREPESFNFFRDILQSRREGSGWVDLQQIVLSNLIFDRLMAREDDGVVHGLEAEGISVVPGDSVWTRSWDF